MSNEQNTSNPQNQPNVSRSYADRLFERAAQIIASAAARIRTAGSLGAANTVNTGTTQTIANNLQNASNPQYPGLARTFAESLGSGASMVPDISWQVGSRINPRNFGRITRPWEFLIGEGKRNLSYNDYSQGGQLIESGLNTVGNLASSVYNRASSISPNLTRAATTASTFLTGGVNFQSTFGNIRGATAMYSGGIEKAVSGLVAGISSVGVQLLGFTAGLKIATTALTVVYDSLKKSIGSDYEFARLSSINAIRNQATQENTRTQIYSASERASLARRESYFASLYEGDDITRTAQQKSADLTERIETARRRKEARIQEQQTIKERQVEAFYQSGRAAYYSNPGYNMSMTAMNYVGAITWRPFMAGYGWATGQRGYDYNSTQLQYAGKRSDGSTMYYKNSDEAQARSGIDIAKIQRNSAEERAKFEKDLEKQKRDYLQIQEESRIGNVARSSVFGETSLRNRSELQNWSSERFQNAYWNTGVQKAYNKLENQQQQEMLQFENYRNKRVEEQQMRFKGNVTPEDKFKLQEELKAAEYQMQTRHGEQRDKLDFAMRSPTRMRLVDVHDYIQDQISRSQAAEMAVDNLDKDNPDIPMPEGVKEAWDKGYDITKGVKNDAVNDTKKIVDDNTKKMEDLTKEIANLTKTIQDQKEGIKNIVRKREDELESKYGTVTDSEGRKTLRIRNAFNKEAQAEYAAIQWIKNNPAQFNRITHVVGRTKEDSKKERDEYRNSTWYGKEYHGESTPDNPYVGSFVKDFANESRKYGEGRLLKTNALLLQKKSEELTDLGTAIGPKIREIERIQGTAVKNNNDDSNKNKSDDSNKNKSDDSNKNKSDDITSLQKRFNDLNAAIKEKEKQEYDRAKKVVNEIEGKKGVSIDIDKNLDIVLKGADEDTTKKYNDARGILKKYKNSERLPTLASTYKEFDDVTDALEKKTEEEKLKKDALVSRSYSLNASKDSISIQYNKAERTKDGILYSTLDSNDKKKVADVVKHQADIEGYNKELTKLLKSDLRKKDPKAFSYAVRELRNNIRNSRNKLDKNLTRTGFERYDQMSDSRKKALGMSHTNAKAAADAYNKTSSSNITRKSINATLPNIQGNMQNIGSDIKDVKDVGQNALRVIIVNANQTDVNKNYQTTLP